MLIIVIILITILLEKLWNPEELEKLKVNDLISLELLSKTQIVWLTSQLLLDVSYVQGIYTKKLEDFRSFLKSSLILHLHNFGRPLSETGIKETSNILRSGTEEPKGFKQKPTSALSKEGAVSLDKDPIGLKVLDHLQSAPFFNKRIEGLSDAATLSIGLRPQGNYTSIIHKI